MAKITEESQKKCWDEKPDKAERWTLLICLGCTALTVSILWSTFAALQNGLGI